MPLARFRAYARFTGAVDDHYRAWRVLGALVAYRAEQQPGEAAVPTRADHQEVAFGYGVDQDLRRRPLHDRALDPDAVDVTHRSERLVEDRLSRLLDSGCRVGDRGFDRSRVTG
jgi:hypothetical protein